MNAQPLDFAQLMPQVATRLLGKPNDRLSKGHRLRFGTNGSMEVDTSEGWFDDHEDGGRAARGGVLDLIQHKQRCDRAGALRWLEEQGLKDERSAQPAALFTPKTFYDYCGADGEVAFRVERRGKGTAKPFLQYGPDGRGGFHAAAGCMQGVVRIPYRLPELLAADPQAIVYVCEGEKDADRLANAGLIATTNPGGAGKFTADLASYLKGRRVVALEDNDEAGAKHVAGVLSVLEGVAAQAAVLRLPGLPPKGDVSDWLDSNSSLGGNSPFDLARLAEEALSAPEEPAEIFEIADLTLWARTQPTPKAFVMAPFIPRDDVVIITGDGGTNKSTLALQISACSAAGKQTLGLDVTPGPALYVTAEDDQRENHWRLDKIASAIGTTLDHLAGRLHIVSLRGKLNNELATFDSDGKLRPAPAYRTLRETIKHTGAKLVTLDNVAHLFAGNENDRSQVTAFINLLYQVCGDFGATILLIAHRNKTGDSYSGSTAWLNAVRSQLMIERSEEHDPDARRLSLGKANYARQGESVEFRWHDFALVRDADLPDDRRKEIAETVMANSDNAAFLACLAERNAQRRQVSEKPTAANFAPKQFLGMPQAKGLTRPRLEKALDRLFRIGAIERGFLYRDTGEGKDVFGLREVGNNDPEGSPGIPETSPETSRKHIPEGTGNPQETTGNTPPIYKYIPGAALEAPAPDNAGLPAPVSFAAFDGKRGAAGMILAPGEDGDDVEL